LSIPVGVRNWVSGPHHRHILVPFCFLVDGSLTIFKVGEKKHTHPVPHVTVSPTPFINHRTTATMKFFSTTFFAILAFFFAIAADAQQQDGGGDAGGGGGTVAAVPPQHLRGLKTRARPNNSYTAYNEARCPYTTYIFCMSKCRSRLYKSIVQCKLENPACAPSSCC
jgi:hypothetical protein